MFKPKEMLIILNSMVVKLTSDINEKPENIAVIKRKIEAYREAAERILGAPKICVYISKFPRIDGLREFLLSRRVIT